MEYFIKSILLGIIVSAPCGANGVLCLNKSLYYGFIAGVMAGLGAAVADGIYSFFAVYNSYLLNEYITQYATPLKYISAFIMVVFGIKLFFDQYESYTAQESRKIPHHKYIKTFIYSFFLTICNPLPFAALTVAFAFLLPTETISFTRAMSITSGVFIGSFLCWGTVSFIIVKAGRKLSTTILERVTKGSALLLVAIGVIIFVLSFF